MTCFTTGSTTVQFVSTASSVAENSGTTSLALAITNPDITTATSVTISGTGATGRVTSFTSPVSFTGGSYANQNCTVTLNNNALCDGSQNVVFTITGVSGGQGTPAAGVNTTHTLTVTDDEVPPTTASVSPTSQTICTTGTTAALGGNTPGVGTGAWSIIGGGAGTFSPNATTPGATFTHTSGTVTALRWTITNGLCTTTADVALTINANPTAATVGGAQTICTTGTTAALGGNTPSVGTGAWSIIGGGAGTFAPNATDPNATFTHTSGTVTALRWTISNSPCTASIADVNITITPAPSATIGYTATPYCGGAGTATVTLTGTSGGVYSATPAGLSINSSTGAVDLALSALGTYTVNYDIAAAGGCAAFNTSAGIGVIACAYYSRATGNVGDAIWSLTPTGAASTAIFTNAVNMIVQSPDVVTINANTTVKDLDLQTGGNLTLASTNTLDVKGISAILAGTVTANTNSTLSISEATTSTLTITGTADLYNFTSAPATSLTVTGAMDIRGTLALNDGIFDASGATVSLRSTTAGSGRLGTVGASATYTGNMKVERYIPAGATNWRLIGSPVAGQTVLEWKDDFITAGFPGSHSPGFSNPPGSGIVWPSVRWYNETLIDPAIDTGWVGASSTAQSLLAGQGFAAWCGTGLVTTTAFTIDVTGVPNIALTPITRALSYTNTSNPTADGWNAASNPLPSPIKFSDISRTNVDDYIWYYNPANGNTATYDISLNVGTNGGSDTIQSSQAFLLKANTGSAQVQFEEADKVLDTQGGFFGGDQVSAFQGLSLKVSSAINTFNDEALVIFSTGTPQVDGEDVPKLTFAHPDAPQIATMAATGEQIAINAFGAYTTDIEIPVLVNVALTGTYTITAANMQNVGLTCITLLDLQTGTVTPLTEGATYSFAINADDSSTEPRLMLRASAPVPLYAEAATCNGAEGRATIVHVGDETMNITWTSANNEVLLVQTIEDGVAINNLGAGDYAVRVSSNAGCGELATSFSIDEPTAMEATAVAQAASCTNTDDGLVDLTVLGGTAPYTYAWSNGSVVEDLQAAPGAYTVEVTDANACVLGTEAYVIPAGAGPVAAATVESNTVLINTPLQFASASGDVASTLWNFGDGTFSEATSVAHSWTTPGTYTVTLTVSDGTCSDTWTTVVVVETSTSITEGAQGTELKAWFANDKFVIEHGIDNGRPVLVEVLDATGRLHLTRNAAGTPARINIPADGLSTGIWFLRISNDDTQRTLRVPVVR